MTTDPQRYRHRTTEVEAVQWTGDNADTLRAFAGPDFDTIDLDDRTEDPDETAAVRESEHNTWRGLKPGDWVVRLDGGLYEFAAADFAKQYMPTAAPAAVPPADRAAAARCAVCQCPDSGSHPAVCFPPADQPGLRDRIADVLADADGWKWAPGFDKTQSPAYRGYQRHADAVLAVMPAPVDRGAVLREAANWFEAGGRYVESLFGHQVAAQLRRLADATPNDGDRRVYAWAQTIDTADSGSTVHIPGVHHGGTGAETVAIIIGREDVPVLAAMLAAGTPQPETQAAPCGRPASLTGPCSAGDHCCKGPAQAEAEARPPRHTWEVESPRRDNWASWGTTYDDHDWATERYEEAVHHYAARPYRLVRATTTYTVEAEHQPDTETPDAPPVEPHPTEADLRHALAVAAKFHGQAATAPAVVAEPGKEA